jgi:hypothetical protein
MASDRDPDRDPPRLLGSQSAFARASSSGVGSPRKGLILTNDSRSQQETHWARHGADAAAPPPDAEPCRWYSRSRPNLRQIGARSPTTPSMSSWNPCDGGAGDDVGRDAAEQVHAHHEPVKDPALDCAFARIVGRPEQQGRSPRHGHREDQDEGKDDTERGIVLREEPVLGLENGHVQPAREKEADFRRQALQGWRELPVPGRMGLTPDARDLPEHVSAAVTGILKGRRRSLTFTPNVQPSSSS